MLHLVASILASKKSNQDTYYCHRGCIARMLFRDVKSMVLASKRSVFSLTKYAVPDLASRSRPLSRAWLAQ